MLVSLPLLRYVISRTECVLWLVNFTGGILSSAFRLSFSGAEIFSFLRGEKCNKKVIYLFFLDLHVRYKIVFSIFVFVLFYIIFAPVYDSLRPVRLIKAFGQSRSLTKALGKGLGQIVLSVVSGPTPTPSYARAERNRTALIPIYPSFKKNILSISNQNSRFLSENKQHWLPWFEIDISRKKNLLRWPEALFAWGNQETFSTRKGWSLVSVWYLFSKLFQEQKYKLRTARKSAREIPELIFTHS